VYGIIDAGDEVGIVKSGKDYVENAADHWRSFREELAHRFPLPINAHDWPICESMFDDESKSFAVDKSSMRIDFFWCRAPATLSTLSLSIPRSIFYIDSSYTLTKVKTCLSLLR
jgi:hypothetical protein